MLKSMIGSTSECLHLVFKIQNDSFAQEESENHMCTIYCNLMSVRCATVFMAFVGNLCRGLQMFYNVATCCNPLISQGGHATVLEIQANLRATSIN